MITILSLKIPSGRATDAVDTVHHNVFSHLEQEVKFIEGKSIWENISLLLRLGPEYALGIGDVREIIYFPFMRGKTRYVIAWHTLLRKTKAWPIRRMLFGRASFIIAVSRCAGETVQKFFPRKKIWSILNGVDTDFFSPLKASRAYIGEKFGVDFEKPLVIFVGALFPRKRPDVFLEVARRYPDAHFVIVGEEAGRDYLSRARGIKNFKHLPFMERGDLAQFMASADIFLFPSIGEPCAAVIPEAMASGLPVILSKSCGNQELVTDGEEGFLVEPSPNEITAFTAHLNQILHNKVLRKRLSHAARRKCLGELHWSSVAKKYLEAFSKNL